MTATYYCFLCKRRHRRDSKPGIAHDFSLPGIFTMPAETYHADPCERPSLSASIANLICSRSPCHAWTAHPRLNPEFERTAESKFDIGSAAHAILLEQRPVDKVVEVIEAPDWRTVAARDQRDLARSLGKIPLLEKDLKAVSAMLAATAEQLIKLDVAPTLFSAGLPERTLIWEEHGITCRARLDWLRDDFTAIDDFKTTSASANPEGWTRTLFTIGADIQTAFYLRGLKALTGVEAEMRYVVQEIYPPYALSVVSLGPAAIAYAEAKVDYALKAWNECLITGYWPGYPSQVCHAEMPSYEMARWDEKEQREVAA